MMTRTARGHTARPLVADRYDTACYVLVAMAAVLASALLWSAGFGLYAVCYRAVLTRPRLDGRQG